MLGSSERFAQMDRELDEERLTKSSRQITGKGVSGQNDRWDVTRRDTTPEDPEERKKSPIAFCEPKVLGTFFTCGPKPPESTFEPCPCSGPGSFDLSPYAEPGIAGVAMTIPRKWRLALVSSTFPIGTVVGPFDVAPDGTLLDPEGALTEYEAHYCVPEEYELQVGCLDGVGGEIRWPEDN